MTQGSLKKKILGDKFLTVTFDLADPGALSEPVGTIAFPLAVIEASTPTFDTRLFDRSFAVSAAAKLPVGIDIRAQHAAIDDVEGLGPVAAPSGTSYADFRLAFDVEVAGAGAVPTSGSGLTVGISAGGALDAAYRHLVPVSAETSRLRAVERVLGDSALPQLLDLRGGKLLDGELHVLSGSCHLDLGLKGRLGGQFDHTMIVEAFDQAVDLLKARVAYSVDATLGYSLDRKMHLVVGRVGTLREGWVRVRLSAEKERRIAFGIVFALQAEYDLGHGLVALLDRIVELEPVTRLKLAMAKLAEVADRLEEPDQTWNVLKQELQGEAAQLIGSYLDDHGWLDRVAGSPELASAFAAAHRIVETYRGLDEKVEELWNQVLAAGELGAGQRLAEVLDRVAGIDPASPEALVNEEWRQVLALIESLTGSSIEEILFGSRLDANQLLAEARDIAARARGFLADAPSEFLTRVHGVAEANGIESVVAWLERNATSPQAFEQAVTGAVSAQVQRAVGVLLGKVWDPTRLDDADRRRLLGLAQSIRGLLDNANGWDEKLKAEARRLKGSLGFSLSLEMERMSRETALVDLELDPSHDGCRQAFEKHLGRGRITDFLGRLAQIDPEHADEELAAELPYMLHDCVLTSKRVRSSSLAVVFSLLGARTDRTQRLVESNVRFLQDPDNVRSRAARYSSALVQTRVEDKMTANAAVWLEIDANGAGHDLTAAYDRELATRLRVTYTREDDFLSSDEVAGLARLLDDLGFVSPGSAVPSERPVRFGLDYRIPATTDVLGALLADLGGGAGETRWNLDVLNAAHRWFDERLVAIADPGATGAYPSGERPLARYLLRLFIRSEEFRRHWTSGILSFEAYAGRRAFTIVDGSSRFRIRPLVAGRWKAPYLCLFSMIVKRGPGLHAVRALAKSSKKLSELRTHGAAMDVSDRFAAAFKTAAPVFWPSPLSAVWLVLARLARIRAGVFDQAEGVATWRWTENGEPVEPLIWRLAPGHGLANADIRQRLFPL